MNISDLYRLQSYRNLTFGLPDAEDQHFTCVQCGAEWRIYAIVNRPVPVVEKQAVCAKCRVKTVLPPSAA